MWALLGSSLCPHGPMLFPPSLSHVLSLGHIFPLPSGFPSIPCLGSTGPSSGNAHCHPSLILSQLSCGCKSAPIIHHLVLALSREQREPGQADSGWRQVRKPGTPSFPRLARYSNDTWCQEFVPGLRGAAKHRGARDLEGGD